MNKIIIWGLKTDVHSHKFIQSGFYKNAIYLGWETVWVNDSQENEKYVKPGDIVFAVNVACKHLPIVRNAKYVLHNISPENLGIDRNYIVIQTHVHGVPGQNLGIPWVYFDFESKTLFQPWGVPSPPSEWFTPSSRVSSRESWVGSIWNNELNQGNSEFMQRYQDALKSSGIAFRWEGTASRFRRNGITERRASKLINKSAIGAAVVGNWQKENGYIPCRLFKNIASGAVPVSNADFSELFGESGGIFEADPGLMIERVKSLSPEAKKKMWLDASQQILPYTYTASMNRILTHI